MVLNHASLAFFFCIFSHDKKGKLGQKQLKVLQRLLFRGPHELSVLRLGLHAYIPTHLETDKQTNQQNKKNNVSYKWDYTFPNSLSIYSQRPLKKMQGECTPLGLQTSYEGQQQRLGHSPYTYSLYSAMSVPRELLASQRYVPLSVLLSDVMTSSLPSTIMRSTSGSSPPSFVQITGSGLKDGYNFQ